MARAHASRYRPARYFEAVVLRPSRAGLVVKDDHGVIRLADVSPRLVVAPGARVRCSDFQGDVMIVSVVAAESSS